MEDATQEQFFPEGLKPMDRTHTGTGEKHEEEIAAERSCYGLTATCHSPLHLSGYGGGRQVGNEAVKLSLGKGGSRGKVF